MNNALRTCIEVKTVLATASLDEFHHMRGLLSRSKYPLLEDGKMLQVPVGLMRGIVDSKDYPNLGAFLAELDDNGVMYWIVDGQP